MESILALSAGEFLPLRKALSEKLLELLAYLMSVPTCRSA
jgi:hypothetical protein